eukprot:219-Rhodomonas_salina.5
MARACYAMSGTDIAYGCSFQAHEVEEDQVSEPGHVCYCPTPRYAMSGTEMIAYGVLQGRKFCRGAQRRRSPLYLRACYAMSGTDTA